MVFESDVTVVNCYKTEVDVDGLRLAYAGTMVKMTKFKQPVSGM